MKRFVKIRKAIALAMCMTFVLALFSGCADDPDPREGYVGSYRVTETVAGILVDDYNITIVKSGVNNTDIVISNFWGQPGWSINATVNGNSFVIPQQTYLLWGASGSGRKDGNTLNYSTLVTASGYGQLNVVSTAVKQ